MQYIITFLEGIITFISPCLLPMLPIYAAYFAGGEIRDTRKTAVNALGFIFGFTIVFVLLGTLAGTVGSFLNSHQTWVNIISGAIVVLFGLVYMNVIRINLFGGERKSVDKSNLGFGSSMLFGIIFSIGWTPCVGAFLGSALMLASQQGHIIQGALLLLIYSLGLGIPFFISALLIDKFKVAFDLVKRNYKVINTVCGGLLIVIGILMMTGMINKLIYSLV